MDINIYNIFWLSFLLPIITKIFNELKEQLYSLIYKSVIIDNSSREYSWILYFITKRIKNVHKLKISDNEIVKYFNNKKNYYILPSGKYYITYNNNILTIVIPNDCNSVIISSFSKNNWDILTKLVDEAEIEYNKKYKTDKKSIGLYYIDAKYDNDFIIKKFVSPRQLNTIVLPTKTKSLIFDNLDLFYEKKSKYYDLGITFKKGILFEGIPGTGKTTLLKTICSKYSINNMYIVDLSLDCIWEKLKKVVDNSMIIIEDIDRYFNEVRDNINSEKIVSWQPKFNFEKLLNFLDGVDSSNNILIVITTNNKNILPEVMFRSGRVDMIVNFTYCDKDQIIEYTNLFFENEDNKIKQKLIEKIIKKNLTISQLQKYYLDYIDNIELALENIDEFLKNLPNKNI